MSTSNVASAGRHDESSGSAHEPSGAADDHSESNVFELAMRPSAPPDAAGAAVRSAALHAGLAGDRATRLRTVVEELVNEACAREQVGTNGDITVRVVQRGHRLSVEVVDRRLPMAARAARSLPSRRLAALGFVDHLHISSHGAEGNVAACELVIDGPAEEVPGGEVLDPAVQRVDDEAAAALEIRSMRPEDASGVAQCVYRCYGYSYLDPIMYRPRALRSAARSGILHSVVAATPSGEIVGHCALTFERRGDRVPEGGKLVVDPRYRGHHLAERLGAVRSATATQLGVPGVWFECVTNHAYSQKEVLSLGGAETGLLIGATPAALTMADLANTSGGRHALLTMWSPVLGGGAATVHLPARHVDTVQQICRRLGLDRAVNSDAGGSTPVAARSRITASVATEAAVAHLRVARIGSDLIDRVADELEGLNSFDLAAVHLDLPVGDAATIGAVDGLESLGFCFGAWLPCFDGGADALRLQRVSDRPVEVSEIACARSEGELLRDHVLAEWRRVQRGGR